MRTALVMTFLWSLLCGLLYPLAATAIAAVLAPERAGGSLLRHGERVVGAEGIGQQFEHPGHLWGRPSATNPPYTPCRRDLAGGSCASNLGPGNAQLLEQVRERVARLRAAAAAAGAEARGDVPVDLVTASASGLDPHVSLAAAEFQVERIARVRRVPAARVRELLATATSGRSFGVLGEPVVHVLRANLALDLALGPVR